VPSLLDQIERVPIASLITYPGNPRRGDVAVIRESLKENGQFAPLVVQTSTRYVLAGNHTMLAARSLRWAEIDVVFVDVDDQRARKIVLAANRTADKGGYDSDALVELLSYLEGDYAGTGYDEADVQALLGDFEPPEPQGDADTGDKPEVFGVIVECDTEQQQTALLGDLDGQGFRVRALIS
jgi:ParB-like chromosome segregation protein Spo0J